MYFCRRRAFGWSHMANDPFQTVADCRSSDVNWVTLREHSTLLTLFPPSKPLEFVAKDILGPLSKSEHWFAYIVVITDRFGKIPGATSSISTSAAVISEGVFV